jgi:hypothetical protein
MAFINGNENNHRHSELHEIENSFENNGKQNSEIINVQQGDEIHIQFHFRFSSNLHIKVFISIGLLFFLGWNIYINERNYRCPTLVPPTSQVPRIEVPSIVPTSLPAKN